METRNEYVTRKKRQLDRWSKDIDRLEANAHRVKVGVRVRYRERLAALLVHRLESEKSIEAVKTAAEGPWDHLKSETENAWAALKDSMHAFKSYF